MENRPLFTVGIPIWNHADVFPLTLMSIAMQTFRSFEVLVCDDASPESAEIEKAIATMNQFMPSPIRYIRFDENCGIGVNRQRLLDNAQGEYLTMIDSDDSLFSVESLQTIAVNILQQRQQGKVMDIVHSRFLESHADGGRIAHEPGDSSWCHSKSYRVDFLREKNITFPTYRFYEDGGFNHVATRLADQQLLVNEITYNWVWTTNSITRGQDYLHVMLPVYADSFWRAYKIVEPIKGRDNILELLIAPLAHCYYYLMGLERRYPADDEYLVATYMVLDEIIKTGKIIEAINASEQRYNQFRQIMQGARNGAMNQDPSAFEHITFADWLQQHFGVSIDKLNIDTSTAYEHKVQTSNMYKDLTEK